MTDDETAWRGRRRYGVVGAQAPRAFSAAYARNGGEALVYGGVFFLVLGVAAAVVNGEAGFLVLSLAGLASSFYFYPTVDHRAPQVAASSRGLYVDRIGTIPWPAIRRVRLRRQALRTMRLAYLTVEVDGRLEEAVIEPASPPLPLRLMTRNWRRLPHGLEIRLHTLDRPAEDIHAAIERFLAARSDGHTARG